MDTNHSEEKSKIDQKKYALFQYAVNVVGAAVVTIVLVLVVFKVFGNGTGDLKTVQAYMLFFIPSFMLIQCHGAITNTRKDFLRGKWVWQETDDSLAPDSIINPWRRLAPLALPAGIAAGLATYLAVPVIGKQPFDRFSIDLIAFIPLALVSTILIIVMLPKDQAALASELKKQAEPVSFKPYLLAEHIIPWMVLQGLINLGIGLKQFPHEALKTDAVVTAQLMAFDMGIVFWIVVFFVWLAAQGQVRPDVQLGRVAQDPRKALSVPLLLAAQLTLIAVVGGAAFGFFTLTGIAGIDPVHAAIIKGIVGMAAAITGSWLGVKWGTKRETAIIQEG